MIDDTIQLDSPSLPPPPSGAVTVTVLGSGSRGNALVIEANGQALLVDAGFSAKELRRRLEAAGIAESAIQAVLITHEHDDHISALRVFTSARELPVYCSRLTAEAIRYAKQAPANLKLFTPGCGFSIGDFGVEPFTIPHDAADPVGFAVHWGERKVGVVTDLGHANAMVCEHMRECHMLVVESNHDVRLLQASERPWALKKRIAGRHGHLSNEACAELLRKVLHERTRHLVLAHASQECNRYEIVEQNARQCLTQLGRTDIVPVVARQEAALPAFHIF